MNRTPNATAPPETRVWQPGDVARYQPTGEVVTVVMKSDAQHWFIRFSDNRCQVVGGWFLEEVGA